MRYLPVLPGLLAPLPLLATCLSTPDVVVFGQMSYVNKRPSLWKIDGKNPYTGRNTFNDIAVKYADSCQVIENKLNVDIALYGLAYYSYRDAGAFEKDDNRTRVLLDRFRVSYNVSSSVRLDVGKIRTKQGLFYLKSPSNLLAGYYAGFKTTRIYDPSMKQSYFESFWGATLAQDTQNYSLSLTVAPKLTDIDKRYESSSNWSASRRANARERYLLTYTDYRMDKHTPSVNLLLGDARSVAISNSYNWTPQFVINAGMAWHDRQQWRHLDGDKARMVERYAFPSELYGIRKKNGVELALGMQYTTDRFSQLGLEYYFQSEGYSSGQWRQQTDLVKFLNQRTNYAPLDQAFDAYKYLMASENYNASSKGSLLGKHYINGWASLLLADRSVIQPYAVLNMVDASAMLGIHYNKPLDRLDKKLDVYTGVYTALGSKHSEFGLFGEAVGTYLGFKYHF
ncbi:hypothetical protein J0B02_09670 [Enterobacteriaceae bacterium YMB-R22]|uniref:hypothetical protein n=1 Tax=Tenebrionicola larvae TaxID=2815733 RepID=UPI0020134175|nr:hypothetical protein [Tenebrionicola larvae]MBV4413077.1 hypothetical protein [Tenebrionicola larvae]